MAFIVSYPYIVRNSRNIEFVGVYCLYYKSFISRLISLRDFLKNSKKTSNP